MTSAALHYIVATIRAHVETCLEFTTSELHPMVLAMLEEWHPDVWGVGFPASMSWLTKQMLCLAYLLDLSTIPLRLMVSWDQRDQCYMLLLPWQVLLRPWST